VLDAVEPGELADQVRHVTLAGGKRVRPTVTVLVCEALGGEPTDATDYAVGIELVHNASLVIDDIIDESDVRRGTPSAWAEYGHGPAIIASDGLLGEAFGLFSADERAMQAVSEAMVELGEGEATELVAQPASEAEYMELARRKTGALFRAAAELGPSPPTQTPTPSRSSVPTPSESASPSRSATTCWTRRPTPENSANPPARTPRWSVPPSWR